MAAEPVVTALAMLAEAGRRADEANQLLADTVRELAANPKES